MSWERGCPQPPFVVLGIVSASILGLDAGILPAARKIGKPKLCVRAFSPPLRFATDLCQAHPISISVSDYLSDVTTFPPKRSLKARLKPSSVSIHFHLRFGVFGSTIARRPRMVYNIHCWQHWIATGNKLRMLIHERSIYETG